jgi:hypothetical protein
MDAKGDGTFGRRADDLHNTSAPESFPSLGTDSQTFAGYASAYVEPFPGTGFS